MKKILLLTIFSIAVMIHTNAQSALDSTVSKQILLGDILIEANPLKNAAHSTVINDKIQNMNQVKNVADLFKEINGISLVKRSNYAIEPVFRSFKHEQLNVQYDGGVKANHACPNRMDPMTTFVIPEEIEKIELIRGPFSVRYGPNFGGVINMVTQRRPTMDNMGLFGSVLSGYESNGGSYTGNATIGYAIDDYDLIVNGSVRDYGNYKDGADSTVSSSFKSYDYSIKTGYNVSDNQRVQLNFRQSFGRDISHAGLPMDSPHDNSTIASFDYKVRDINSKLYAFDFKLYYSYVDHLMSNINRKNFKIVTATTPVYATTMGGKMEFELTPSSKNILYLGADFSSLSRDGDRTRLLKRNPMNPEIVFDPPKLFTDTVWQDPIINSLGLFGEGKYISTDKLSLGYGLRVDFVNATSNQMVAEFIKLYENGDNVTDINLSGHLSLSYQVSDVLHLQLALGRGVRSGSMEEKYINHLSINKDPYEYVGDPLIKPEANHQIELNIGGNSSNFHYGANLFYSYITNYITAAVDSTLKRKYLAFLDPKLAKRIQNVDLATQAGFEVFGALQVVDNVSIKAEVAYTHGYNADWDEPLAQIAPLSSTISIKYETERFWTDLRGKFVSKQDRISIKYGEEITPNYTVLDFRIGFKPLKNLTIAGAVLNVLDEYYYDHLNFSYTNSTISEGKIYEPGMNINLFVKYDF